MHENIQNEFGKIIKSLKRQVEKKKANRIIGYIQLKLYGIYY
jgi:hypothetical protein